MQCRAAAEQRLLEPTDGLRIAGVVIVLLIWSALAGWAWVSWIA